MTLLSVSALLAYFFVLLATAINQEKYSLTNSQYIKDLYFDDTLYNYTTDQFDYAVQLSYAGTNASVTNLFQYFSIKMYLYEGKVKTNY